MRLRPYSLGHELWLIREQNPLALEVGGDVTAKALLEAALICSQSHAECERMSRDWFLPLKLKLWTRRIQKGRFNYFDELESFRIHQASCSVSFKCSRPSRPTPSRAMGTPFVLRLNQFLIEILRLTEAQAWDYPFGLAQMRFQAHHEEQGALEVENPHDASFDEYCRQQDALAAKEGVTVCRA